MRLSWVKAFTDIAVWTPALAGMTVGGMVLMRMKAGDMKRIGLHFLLAAGVAILLGSCAGDEVPVTDEATAVPVDTPTAVVEDLPGTTAVTLDREELCPRCFKCRGLWTAFFICRYLPTNKNFISVFSVPPW